MTDNPSNLVSRSIDSHRGENEVSGAWGVWNVVAFVTGTAATMHAAAALHPVDWAAMAIWLPGLYQEWIVAVWKGLFDWLTGDVAGWVWSLPTYAYLFAMISVRATSARHLEEHAWPVSGKMTDFLMHFALWPLIALFYLLSLLRITELVDHDRLMEVRSTVWTFFASIIAGAVLWGAHVLMA